MDIGKPIRITRIVPAQIPVPPERHTQPIPQRAPARRPAKAPGKTPVPVRTPA
jgi:hypothetical protein